MRQGQQNRRGRGRHNNNNHNNNNNNRKGHNPLTRSYESNGPEVKIRGNPAHIAEKYISLARDAQTSGDPVLAENYLQHAEHYNRIILAFREQQGHPPAPDASSGGQRFRSVPSADGSEDGDDDIDGTGEGFGGVQGEQQVRGQEPQPGIFEGQPAPQQPQQQSHGQHQPQGQHRGQRYDDRGPRRHGGDQGRPYDPNRQQGRDRYSEPREPREQRGYSNDRQDRGDRPDRGERHDRGERPDRGERQERFDRAPRPERVDRPVADPVLSDVPGAVEPVTANGRHEPAGRGENPGRRRERYAAPTPAHEQPDFLRRPVRRPRRDPDAVEGGDVPPTEPEGRD